MRSAPTALFASVSDDATIRLWDARVGRTIATSRRTHNTIMQRAIGERMIVEEHGKVSSTCSATSSRRSIRAAFDTHRTS